MSEIAISVEGLSKAYRLGVKEDKPETLVQALGSTLTAPLRNFRRLRRLDTFESNDDSEGLLWALKDVSFQVEQGEVVGFVGRNGAGKSTLLKILSRIAEPTSGRVEINGRVSSLLEVGTGFHQELTGRENVYMNGTILGMKKSEIDAKFDEIVEFSGVERFLDTPVKRYSSGMKVRLAFSVAAHLEPEILIVDEVLAVGDADFQKKCLGKMQDLSGGGRTVLFVSHNMGAVQSLCSRALALRSGGIVDDGVPASVVSSYLALTKQSQEERFAEDNPEREGTGGARFEMVTMCDENDIDLKQCLSGDDLRLVFQYRVSAQLDGLALRLAVVTDTGIPVFNISSDLNDFGAPQAPGLHNVECFIPRFQLVEGAYRINVRILDGETTLDFIPGAIVFDVIGNSFFESKRKPIKGSGFFCIDHVWSAELDDATLVTASDS
ncbi:MAG: ABC transporter ATP-binding protein [Congregibacter sp.]